MGWGELGGAWAAWGILPSHYAAAFGLWASLLEAHVQPSASLRRELPTEGASGAPQEGVSGASHGACPAQEHPRREYAQPQNTPGGEQVLPRSTPWREHILLQEHPRREKAHPRAPQERASPTP